MLVIAQVKGITEHTAQDSSMGMSPGEKYLKCQVEKVDHMVNFTSHIIGQKKDADTLDYSFTDYVITK